MICLFFLVNLSQECRWHGDIKARTWRNRRWNDVENMWWYGWLKIHWNPNVNQNGSFQGQAPLLGHKCLQWLSATALCQGWCCHSFRIHRWGERPRSRGGCQGGRSLTFSKIPTFLKLQGRNSTSSKRVFLYHIYILMETFASENYIPCPYFGTWNILEFQHDNIWVSFSQLSVSPLWNRSTACS